MSACSTQKHDTLTILQKSFSLSWGNISLTDFYATRLSNMQIWKEFLSESVFVGVYVSHAINIIEGHLSSVIVQLDFYPSETLLHCHSLTKTITAFSTAI